jgi:hypothetical protein
MIQCVQSGFIDTMHPNTLIILQILLWTHSHNDTDFASAHFSLEKKKEEKNKHHFE